MHECGDDDETLEVDYIPADASARADGEGDAVVAQILRVLLEPSLGAEFMRVGKDVWIVME